MRKEKLLACVLALDKDACARASNDLNCFEWPEDFGPRPPWADTEETISLLHAIFHPHLDAQAGPRRLRADWRNRKTLKRKRILNPDELARIRAEEITEMVNNITEEP